MSATPALTEPADATTAQQREADTAYYRAVLHELIEIGTTLARTLHHQATSEHAAPQPAPTPATAADLAPLAGFAALTRLDLLLTGVADLAPLDDLPRLEMLFATSVGESELGRFRTHRRTHGLPDPTQR